MSPGSDDREHIYDVLRGPEVIARGTLAFIVRNGGRWSAMFATDTPGLDGAYDIRLASGDRLPITLRDLSEANARPSHLHGEVPYGNRRQQTYALSGDGEPLVF